MLLSQQHCCRPRCHRNSDCYSMVSLLHWHNSLPKYHVAVSLLYLESLRHSIVGIVSTFLRHHLSPLLFDAVIIILPSQSTIKSDRRLQTRTIVYHTILDFNSCLFVEQCCRILHVESIIINLLSLLIGQYLRQLVFIVVALLSQQHCCSQQLLSNHNNNCPPEHRCVAILPFPPGFICAASLSVLSHPFFSLSVVIVDVWLISSLVVSYPSKIKSREEDRYIEYFGLNCLLQFV